MKEQHSRDERLIADAFVRQVRSGRLVCVYIPLLIFGGIAVAVAAGSSVPGDRAIYRFLGPFKDVDETREAALFFAGRTIEAVGAALVAAIFLALIGRRRLRAAAFLAASLVPSALTPLLKNLFARQPPDFRPLSSGWSFPSGHASGSMAVAAAAVALVWPSPWRRPLLIAAVPLVAAIGLSAVIGGNHWPSDVIAAWSLALAWVGALLYSGGAGGNAVWSTSANLSRFWRNAEQRFLTRQQSTRRMVRFAATSGNERDAPGKNRTCARGLGNAVLGAQKERRSSVIEQRR